MNLLYIFYRTLANIKHILLAYLLSLIFIMIFKYFVALLRRKCLSSYAILIMILLIIEKWLIREILFNIILCHKNHLLP